MHFFLVGLWVNLIIDLNSIFIVIERVDIERAESEVELEDHLREIVIQQMALM